MNRRAMPTRNSIVLAVLLIAACGNPQADPRQVPPLAGADIGGAFELISEDGKPSHWSDFAGKYRIVYFGYTFCPDVCPTAVQRAMAGLKLFEKDKPALDARVQPLFITIDPARDTPQVVGEFTENFHPRLLGLTGTQAQVDAAAKAFRVYARKQQAGTGGAYLMDHSDITYLFGPSGEPIATLPTDLGPQAVAAELEKWVR